MSLISNNIPAILTACLIGLLFGASGVVWGRLIQRRRRGQPFLEYRDGPRADWRSLPEMVVAYVALLWLVLLLWPRFMADSSVESREISLVMVLVQAGINFGLVLMLPLVLTFDRKPISLFGITAENVRDQISVGVQAFFASVLPMAISMAVTSPFRPPESQNSLLKLLTETPTPAVIAAVAIHAGISVPLWEELQFRVILQGLLTKHLGPFTGILTVAVLFALVHGWRDGIALLPLALILGYVYYRRNSYLAVVVIHALFNATMLVFQLLNPQPTQ